MVSFLIWEIRSFHRGGKIANYDLQLLPPVCPLVGRLALFLLAVREVICVARTVTKGDTAKPCWDNVGAAVHGSKSFAEVSR
jgi:hypothetical protein